ncbi:MAG TPA: histidine kinase [Solirubrobacteraceae bacterium]|nr:histidine kinase [Solirubrobacteraceae bacterium]
MLLTGLNPRVALLARLVILGLVTWSIAAASAHPPTASGRGLAVSILLAVCLASAVRWLRSADEDAPVRPDAFVMSIAGGALLGASPDTAASAFVFVAVVTAALREGLARSMQLVALGTLALTVTVLIWDRASLALLAYALGFAAAGLAASNRREARLRAEQAELLLAESQRSHEEALRAARLEESARIAREIHDVLAHSLAGLTLQLEATTALLENGADRDTILARVRRAHELARDGLRETRRAVGALRGDEPSVERALATLTAAESTTLTIDGDASRLRGEVGRAVLRVVQESLTNVAKHAPGSETAVAVTIGEEIVVVVENRLAAVPVPAGPLASSGGGYGIAGMRERAEALAGTLAAGPTPHGWRVELRIPSGGEASM